MSIYGASIPVTIIILAMAAGAYLIWRQIPARWFIMSLVVLALAIWGTFRVDTADNAGKDTPVTSANNRDVPSPDTPGGSIYRLTVH